ncbi:MAG: S8/S53 family peptidase [Rhodocyclales bacterium]|nr:S8/S53 family peptidase [Rhodocyclales bacterium]
MPLDIIATATTEILILRLKPHIVPQAFQSNVELAAGMVPGELLAWLGDDWFYLSEGSEALLAGRLAPAGKSVDRLCLESGAAEVARIPLAEFVLRHNRRADRKAFLRDSGAVGIALPGVVGDTATLGGRNIELDWQLTITGIHRAWGLFAPTPGALPWAGIRIGHIDTGCTVHPALGFVGATSSYVRTELGLNFYADSLPLPIPGGSDLPELPGPFDNLSGGNGGHGTRTMSTLAGFHDAADGSLPPFYGAAPGATVIPYRVTNSILIDAVQRLMVDAIDDAIGKGCRVISMSLGGIIPWAPLARAIDRAYEAGVIVCAAAGNVIREVTYPGRYNRCVTLGGASPQGTTNFGPWKDSSRGQFVDVCGPADGIRRASVERRGGGLAPFITGNGSGTSYATAICAGIATLWLAKRQAELSAAYGPPSWQWPAAFKRLIKETAIRPQDIDAAQPDWDVSEWGRGMVRADRLLLAALPAPTDLHHEAEAAAPFDPAA